MNEQIINNIRTLGIDMINTASSGHPGIVLGAAPIIYTLFSKHMNMSFNDKTWINRDRFVLSAGHGSALLYATMYLAGYDISLDDLKNFRKINSKTSGHPEITTPGIEATTGLLGQGIATAVGMAIGEKYLETKLTFPKKTVFEGKNSLIDYNIYVLCSDGDLMEGISYEACSLAGTLKLSNLTILYDSNNISLDGTTSNTFNEDVLKRFAAMRWNTISVKNTVKDIDKALTKASYSDKPTIIKVNTVLGEYSLLENTNEVHGKPLTSEDVNQLRKKLNSPDIPFFINEEAKNHFHNEITKRSNNKYEKWSKNYDKFSTGEMFGGITEYKYLFNEKVEYQIPDLKLEDKESMYIINQIVMNEIAKHVPNFIGGSSDLMSSTKVYLNNSTIYNNDYKGKNIFFGVREHSMAAILNGLALTKLKPYGGTYLAFSDYLKPAIRMSALMDLPVTYIFTHDSIMIGKDGPTHQPIEQLSSLRLIPNMTVFRPCDYRELIGSWNYIIDNNKPCSLVIGKNEVDVIEGSKIEEVKKGAYIIEKEKDQISAIIIATGYEVHTAIHIARDLYNDYKIDIRVVSMPSVELFLKMNKEYQDSVLIPGYKNIVIEAGSSSSWHQFVYSDKYLITLNNFGISGSKDDVLKHNNFDYESIKNRIINLLR